MTFEYRVVPAPVRGRKGKGLKSPAERFANALAAEINAQAAAGWEYLRTDTLPAEERSGLTGRTTVFQNMLIFRRPAEATAETAPEAAPARAPLRALAEDLPEPATTRLPSAESAQALPETVSPAPALDAGAPRKDMAAE